MSIKSRLIQTTGPATLRLLRFVDRLVNGSHSGVDAADMRRDPYAEYKLLRLNGPVLRSYANRGWIILGFEQVQAVFKDSRFISDLRKNKFIVNVIRAAADGRKVPILDEPSMLNLDAPDHTRLRKLVARGFLHKYIQSLEPAISTIVDKCLDGIDLTADKFDLVDQLAKPLPAIVIAEMLGLPEKDRVQFQKWSNDLLGLTMLDDPEMIALATIANVELVEYFKQIIEQKRQSPGQDLITQLIAAEEEGDRLTAHEMYATCVLLLTAGHETTTRLISNGMCALLQHPEQLAMLQRDPSLTPNAVEEMLRYEPPVQFMPRIAAQDIDFYGNKIKKNQLLLVSIASANRDEFANPDPDTFDITRESVQHVSFGHGIHLCLGLSLARLEAKVAINALLQRYPNMTLTPQTIDWSSNQFVRGMAHLYVDTNVAAQVLLAARA